MGGTEQGDGPGGGPPSQRGLRRSGRRPQLNWQGTRYYRSFSSTPRARDTTGPAEARGVEIARPGRDGGWLAMGVAKPCCGIDVETGVHVFCRAEPLCASRDDHDPPLSDSYGTRTGGKEAHTLGAPCVADWPSAATHHR